MSWGVCERPQAGALEGTHLLWPAGVPGAAQACFDDYADRVLAEVTNDLECEASRTLS